MKGIILAAGYGTRLRPVTYTLPKPLVPLCNRPLIGWAVESYLAAGVRDLIVNLHHLPAPLEAYLRAEYAYADRASFFFSFEQEILGTGGAIRRVRPQLEGEEDFFLVNGDTVQFPPLDKLADARRDRDALAALTLRHPPEGDRFTAVFAEDGFINGFREGRGEALMFSGSHCISTRVFDLLPDREFSGIVGDVYEQRGDESLAAVIDDDALWFDIGTPQRYLTASRAFLDAMRRGALAPPQGSRVQGDSLVHETANMSQSFSLSTVGAGSIVKGEVIDCVIWNDCTIADGARLESCIVAHGVEIPRDLELRNALVCRDDAAIPDDTTYERRDGLVLLPL
ncbi:MAG TPA: NDP-sugar synthase [Thermoanaerobaculia bacterium]|nr:NDP-sugar synthase [Thermoanaerobaculia bacterium]